MDETNAQKMNNIQYQTLKIHVAIFLHLFHIRNIPPKCSLTSFRKSHEISEQLDTK